MELIGSWRFGENACLPRRAASLPWPVVTLIARLSVAEPRPEWGVWCVVSVISKWLTHDTQKHRMSPARILFLKAQPTPPFRKPHLSTVGWPLSATLPGCLAAPYALGSARSGFEATPVIDADHGVSES